MPPVQYIGDFPGVADELLFKTNTNQPQAADLNKRAASTTSNPQTLTVRSESTSTKTYSPGHGSIDPGSIKMKGLLALFALIGAAFVLTAIWFFFWAKNGGFVWRRGDWEEYKSTVLRRKGPDGKTLSNATKSTKLGGGSIVGKAYRDYDDYTESGTGYGYTDTATSVTEKQPRQKARNFKEAAKKKLLRRWKDERHEGDADDDVRAYRQEKPARVGGINRAADGTYHGSDYDTSNPGTNYNATNSEMSEVRDYAYAHEPRRHSHHQKRRDFSFTPGTEDTASHVDERSHLREPENRRHNRRRERRRNPPASSSRQNSPRKKDRRSVPGGYAEPLDFSSAPSRSDYQYSNVDLDEETGTKSYHHPIPGLSKGYRRDGGRRRRRDSLSESDGDETGYS